MLATIYHQLVALCVAAIANILMGMYNNINLENCNFNIKKFFTGVIKAGIIIATFIAVGYCFDVTDLSALGVTPDLVINAAIVLYIGKAMQNLMKVLGVTLNTNIANAITSSTEILQQQSNNTNTDNKTKPVNFEDSVG